MSRPWSSDRASGRDPAGLNYRGIADPARQWLDNNGRSGGHSSENLPLDVDRTREQCCRDHRIANSGGLVGVTSWGNTDEFVRSSRIILVAATRQIVQCGEVPLKTAAYPARQTAGFF